MSIIVYGTDYSLYTRIVRMVLEIKTVEYKPEPVGILDTDAVPDDYADMHPFMKTPEGATLLETFPRVTKWWQTLSATDWAVATAPP